MREPEHTMYHFLRDEPPLLYTRGGSVLWNAIREDLNDEPVPEAWAELKSLFCNSYKKLTGHDIEDKGIKFVASLDRGGMSGGQVSPEFFNDAVLYFLRRKFNGNYVDGQDPMFLKWFDIKI